LFLSRLRRSRSHWAARCNLRTLRPAARSPRILRPLSPEHDAFLKGSPRARRANKRLTPEALLKGLIFTATCSAITPTYTRKGERLFYYYASIDRIRSRTIPDGAAPLRPPAGMVDAAVIAELRRLIAAPEIAARVVANYARHGVRVDEAAIVAALRRFNELWEALFPAEQARIVRLLVNKVTVGPASIAVDLRNNGLAHFVRDLAADTRQEVVV
jgi:site-specific DNA recombinase